MYEESFDMVNRALRYLPHNWTDWGMMVSFLQLYLIRSQQSLTFGCLSRAVSDYGHAFTLLTTYDNPEAMREWFTQQESHLLVEMIQLKGKLLAAEKIAVDDVHFNAKNKQSMNRLEVDGALEMLFQLEKLSNEADVSSESLKVKGQASSNKSYEMSTKIKLHKAEAGGGRCFLASEYIAKGETILTEKPYSVTTFQEHIYTHCNYCHIAMETFWPCHEVSAFP